MDVLEFVNKLEPNLSTINGDFRKIADIHISIYKFYIRFASRCDGIVFDKKCLNYLESCIRFLESKKLTSKALLQSRSNLIKILDLLNDLCISLGGDKEMLSKIYTVIDKAVADDPSKEEEKSEAGGALDLLKQLKNLLNDPVDNDDDSADGLDESDEMDTGPLSPANSTGSSMLEDETSRTGGGVESMTQYLLSDGGMDNSYYNHIKALDKRIITCRMNDVMAKACSLRENKYIGLDNMIAKMKINVPIWNYNIDRVDTIDTNNVMENMEIFEGNKSVTDAVLYSCPDFLVVGPFEVYLRNKVYVYHCLVQNCNDCMTTSLEFLKLHVKFTHGESEIDWNCSACELINIHSAGQRSLDGALDHLAKCHSMKTTYTLSKERLMDINKMIARDTLDFDSCPKMEVNEAESDEGNNNYDMDFFHCPVSNCKFSTNSLTHAFSHFSLITDDSVSLACRYCSLVLYRNYEFCEHLVKQHGNANYKCGYCPYRTVSRTNSVFHQRDMHPEQTHKILSCEPISDAKFSYDCRAHNSLKPFMCFESCAFSSHIEQKFTSHLLDHAGVTIICRYCSKYETHDIGELRDHLLIHGVGEYHCVYCKEAFNFISKVERHLHEKHSSQYPFIIVCQDFDSRSHSLKGKYNKIQKLDIGTESVIVVALESDKSVCPIVIISPSESIVVEDVDHCKMQLKQFMKNTHEEVAEEIESLPQPHQILESFDLTVGEEDPRERVDIKPRIRVRNIEQLRSSWLLENPQADEETNGAIGADIGTSSFLNEGGDQPDPSSTNTQPVPSNITQLGNETASQTPVMSSAQIKKEKVTDSSDTVLEQGVGSNPTMDSVQPGGPTDEPSNPNMKKERADSSNRSNAAQSPSKKIKNTPKTPSEEVRVKQEAFEAQNELIIDDVHMTPSFHSWEDNEDNSAAAAIAQRDEFESESEIPSNQTATIVPGLLPLNDQVSEAPKINSRCNPEPNDDNANDVDMESAPANIDIAPHGNDHAVCMDLNNSLLDPLPILDVASIDDIPVDFDCDIPQPLVSDLGSTVDVKTFDINDIGTLVMNPIRYKDPTILDTVIISDGEDDDDYSMAPSNSAGTSLARLDMFSPSPTPSTSSTIAADYDLMPMVVSTQSVTSDDFQLTPGSSTGQRKLELNENDGTTLKISSTTSLTLMNSETKSSGHTYLRVDPHSKNSKTKNLLNKKPSPPMVETRKFRCKLCNFTSEDRKVTYEHLYSAHPSKLSERARNFRINTTRKNMGNIVVKGVSCPYCPDKVYEGIKSFEKHHSSDHGDYSEIKCFIIFPPSQTQHPIQVFACGFCGSFCPNEEAVWDHTWAMHGQKIKLMKKPFKLRAMVAMKKMVCPLYDCLDEFLQPQLFREHMQCHTTVIACKTCTYIADSVEAFQKFHNEMDPVDRLTHFFYRKSPEDIANLVNVVRFNNPLYSLNSVLLDDDSRDKTPVGPRKTTARKSTGAQYRHT